VCVRVCVCGGVDGWVFNYFLVWCFVFFWWCGGCVCVWCDMYVICVYVYVCVCMCVCV